ncbi:FRG domain-containing protein [Pantoea stewartii]|uniref:FRG domain-containing protein n=1 Tax=Pantoea stewartii TaxID=66269 RepID=UPI00197F36C8|nr:FRG domain-containing protein [Pantoea stewartii]
MGSLTVIECKKAKDFLNEITPWNSRFDLSKFVFRGHSKETYKLLPNAFRDREHQNLNSIARLKLNENFKFPKVAEHLNLGDLAIHHASLEFHVLRRFYRKANANGLYVPRSKFMSHSMERSYYGFEALMRLYTYNNWLERDLLEIASIAQHYGLPTRLIDWSYNPYTAAFFASNGRPSASKGKICLWMMNTNVLAEVFEAPTSDVKIYNPHYQWNDNARSQFGLFTHKVTTFDKDYFSMRKEFLMNLMKQEKYQTMESLKKMFTDFETFDGSVDRLVNDYNKKRKEPIKDDVLIKITLPDSEVNELNKQLRKINISEGSIYPGYSGVVSDLMNANSLR